ncbi:hypothetical protein BD289DRAFT_485834 [Coniella lustricola]|uniref:Uncharacterized protein n=1 Tax=Coniella lustricola TaxID=2025994 RepID=A0A2T2ZX44_9PEZI|nr:hypothetical protein BD289DRAFT_485834 [Coniella lustricola]
MLAWGSRNSRASASGPDDMPSQPLRHLIAQIYKRRTSLALKSSLPISSTAASTASNNITKKAKAKAFSIIFTLPTSTFTTTLPDFQIITTMAVYSTSFVTERPMLYGRSGYNNKPTNGDDDDSKNQGRSGYNNKPNGDDDEDKNQGRSGYNSKPDGSDDDQDNKKSFNFA